MRRKMQEKTVETHRIIRLYEYGQAEFGLHCKAPKPHGKAESFLHIRIEKRQLQINVFHEETRLKTYC